MHPATVLAKRYSAAECAGVQACCEASGFSGVGPQGSLAELVAIAPAEPSTLL
jgi:hypothetical protein